MAYNFISEGAEEVLSDLSDPLAKYLTGVDKNVGENYKETFKGLPETFFVGGSVGTLMGGAQDFMRSKSKGQAERGGAAATRADYSLRNVIEMNENEGSGANAEKYAAAKMSSYQMMSYELQRMSPEHRAKYLESIGVHKLAFNEKDGTLKAKAAESVNAEAVTPTLRALSGNLSHAPITEGVQISESAKTAKETVLKALGSRANVAITDAIEGDNALYNPDEDVIYISNGALDGSDFNNEDIARAVALHEVAHKAEGTRAYLDMVDEVQKILGDENAPADVKALIGDRVQRRKELVKSYWDRNLSREQNRYVVDTELISNMLGDLLGNSYFVERMGKRNSSAWERFVMAMKAADAGKAAGISKESQKYLSGLYKAYVKAVDDARQGVKVSAMVDEEEKEKAPEGASGAADAKMNMRYSLSKNAKAELHKALYDTSYRSEVKLRDVTPDIMISQKGVKNLPMAMNASHIRENVFTEAEAKRLGLKVDKYTHYHGLGEEFFLKIIDGLDNVTEAYRGTKNAREISRRENYFLLVSTFSDKDGNTINVPVYVNERAIFNRVFIDVNKIATVFGKNAFRDYINRQIQEGNLVRIKNRNTQTSERPALIAGGYEMGASTNSIPQDSEKSTENEKKVSDERSSKKASKAGLGENFKEDKYYARQIDGWETLKSGGYITVGEIVKGSPLDMIGIPSGTLYFDVSKILKEMRDRKDAIPPDKIKEIPNVLDNPIVITEFVDKSGGHSANVYGNLYIGSSPVVVGVMIAKTQKGSIVSKIQTVHPNRNVLKEMSDDNILYLSENKKETKAWFQSLGAQKPPLGGNTFGFIRSISHSDGFVNRKNSDERASKKKVYRSFDISQYDEIELSAVEYSRLHSEALTWGAKYRNIPLTTTLTYDIVYGDTIVKKIDVTYRYIIDKKGNIYVYNREDAVANYAWGEDYGNASTTQPDLAVEKLGVGQRDNGRDSGALQDGRESADHDRNDLRSLSGTGEGERNRRSIHRPLAHRQKENGNDGSSEKITTDERSSKKKVYKKADASAVLKRPRITADMSESERYDVLKKRNIRNVPAATNLSKVIAAQEMEATSWEDVNKYIGSDKRVLVRKIASEFGAIGKEYFNQDIQLSFEFSGNNFEESYSKQKRNFIDFARMFSVFDSVVENAIGVEVHKRPNYKFDPTLENMFVLISAYQHDGFIVPIKLEIKQFKDKPNALYVAISLNKIKMTEVSGQGNTETGVTQGSRSVTISIADIFKKINPSDKSFLKYIPDDFLSKEQKTAKREALAEDERKNSVKEKPKNERSSKQKDHLKKDASAVIYHALSKHLRVSDSYSKLLRATAKEAKQKLYDALNNVEGEERNAVAFEIADYLIDNAVIKAFESNPNAKANAETLAKFDVYLHKIDLDSIKEEIKKHFGKDLTPYGLWGKHKGKESVSVETIKAELSENGIVLNATEPAEIFFELHNARKAASEALESTGYALVKNSLSEEERNTTRQEIAEEILKAYNERGVTSKRVKKLERQAFEYVYERAKKRAEVWKARYYEEIDRNYIANRLLEKVRHLDELKKGAFLNATQSKTFVEKFKGSVFRLSRIRFRGNLNRRGTRKIFAALSEWYSDKENLIVRGTEGVYNESIAAALESIAKNEKPLSESENATVDVKALVGDRVQSRKELVKSYWDKNLSREQNRYVVDTELISNMLGDLLGNSYFVERMAKRNSSAWERFVMAMKAADAGKAAGISKESQKYLSGLYKAYVKAVDKAGGGVKVSSIADEEEKEKAPEGASGANERESRQKTVRYISFKRIGTQTVRQIRAKLTELYDGQDGVADGIAIAVGETVYIVDSGCEDGEIAFGVRRRKTIANEVARSEFIKETNDDAVSKIQVSNGLYERVGGRRSGNVGHRVRRESGTKIQADSGKSRNNGGGASEQAAGVGGLNNERKSKQSQAKKVIDLSSDDKLSALVKDVHGSKRYNIIREYILAELAEQPIRLSDGKMAVVDKRDAQHMARGAGTKKTAAISHIKEIVESAELVAEEARSKENKFSHFWYYEAHALYEGEPISLYVNVGQARNAPSYHIYDITKKIRDTAHRVYDVGRPVGHAILNGISNNSIPQKSEKSTETAKKHSNERSSKKVYRRPEASAAIEDTVKKLFVFTDAYANLKGQSKREAASMLWKALNTAEEDGARRRAALDVADYVLDHAVVAAFEGNTYTDAQAETVAVLRPYLHKLDLDGIKGELKEKKTIENRPISLIAKAVDFLF